MNHEGVRIRPSSEMTDEEFEKEFGCPRSTAELMDQKSDEELSELTDGELSKLSDVDSHGVAWERQAKIYAARLVLLDRRYHELWAKYDEYKKRNPPTLP